MLPAALVKMRSIVERQLGRRLTLKELNEYMAQRREQQRKELIEAKKK